MLGVEKSPADAPLEDDRQALLATVLDIDEEALRGLSLSTVLANRARLFAEEGKAAREDPTGTFALSRPVQYLSHFMSHSWRTGRLVKYAALCVHFNLRRAAIASAFVNFLAFTYVTFNMSTFFWRFEQPHLADGREAIGSGVCELLAPTVFTAVLFLGHLPFDDGTFFLDIACISQDDARKKATGIASLGAILDRSERMLVMCDGNYFSRLWCLFELSAFAKRAGVTRIDFVPLHVPLRIVGWCCCFCIFYTVMTGGFLFLSPLLVRLPPEEMTTLLSAFTVFCMAGGLPIVLTAELEAQEIRQACAALRSFKLTDAQCYSPTDRAAILGLIAKWWTDTASGETHAQRLIALGEHKFESFVRLELAPQLAGLAGKEWSVGRLAAMYVICTNGWILDMIAFEGTTPYHLVAYLGLGALTFGVFLPCLFEGIRALAGLAWRQKRAGWPAWAYCGLFYVLAVLFLFATFMVVYVLPVPNVLLDPSFRWPADGLSEFGNQCLKFEAVLALHCLAAGVTYASR